MYKEDEYEFWNRVDIVNLYRTLTELIKRVKLNYGSTKSEN